MSEEETTIYVGRKPPTNYVMAVVTAFNVSNAKQIVLKARGRAISTAVDVAEIARRQFLKDVEIDKIEIGSEDIQVKEENRTRTVPTIEITLKRSS
ncbi:MAG: DNA-binding protein Alba [Candidatus Bathyarchaeia archaeon]